MSSCSTAATAGERVPLPCPRPSPHPHLPHPHLVQCWPPGASCCFVSAPICTSRCSRKGCRLPGGARSTQWKGKRFLPHLAPSTCLRIVALEWLAKKTMSFQRVVIPAWEAVAWEAWGLSVPGAGRCGGRGLGRACLALPWLWGRITPICGWSAHLAFQPDGEGFVITQVLQDWDTATWCVWG